MNVPRHPIHPAIDEDLVAAMVDRFYGRVRSDPVLGPIFDAVIDDGWDRHLRRMKDFWSSVTLMTGRYKGTPFEAHRRIDGIKAAHFDRWLHLWRETAAELCAPPVAAVFIEKAERIGRSLLYGLADITNPAPNPIGRG
ncbi:MAG: group III truncated hemoglobin [Bauldia sp.]